MFRIRNIFFFRGLNYIWTPKLKERLRSLALLTAGGSVTFYGIGLWSNDARFYSQLVMPLVQRLDAETAHRAAVWAASHGLVPRDRTPDPDVLATHVWGMPFSNPIGLAAGFDKHAEACDAMLGAGFGFVEVGSVTPEPQPGNPRPRVFRLSEDCGVINRYGFNSEGHVAAADRLRARPVSAARVGVNLGKNKTTRDAAADYVAGVAAFADIAGYFVVNVSSPNTPGLRELQKGDDLESLLDRVLDARDRLCPEPRPPVLLKISPDLTDQQRRHVARCALARKDRLGGLVVSNTTVSRPGLTSPQAAETGGSRPGLTSAHAAETGGLSGRPLTVLATTAVSDMYRLTDGAVPIVGVGGVFTGRDAYEKIRAGASLVQLYTALSIHGPPVVSAIKQQLAQLLSEDGFASVEAAVGADHRTANSSVDQPSHNSASQTS